MSILHITNGDIAAAMLRKLDPTSEVLPWRDALHEGPVPGGVDLATLSDIRALFVSAAGWAPYSDAQPMFQARDTLLREHRRFDEIALWFEWDLYDQLQLLQVLDFLVLDGRPLSEISLLNFGGYFGDLALGDFAKLADDAVTLDEPMAALAVRAWQAVRAADPGPLVGLLQELSEQEAALPFLPAALYRLIEELPSQQNGLSRSEQQILDALSNAPMAMSALFIASHSSREDRIFLADAVFATQVERLAADPAPLVQITRPFFSPWGSVPDGLWDSIVEVTSLGRKVLFCEVDWLTLGAAERWVGGMMVDPRRPSPRWDRSERRVVFPE